MTTPDWILGTAGHIDHGKTALVQRLTGINTDRLVEEQRRGMTIDIGFAHLTFPDGTVVGIVDVPGHEQFIRNMVAGASGIDAAMLVVAADDGVMPQTREHLDILQFLGIESGLVTITKADLVDQDWIELVREDIDNLVKGTFLEDAPVAVVSAKTGQGIGQLIEMIESLGRRARRREIGRPFRMHIDRSFRIQGFGCVVTGSAISGRVAKNDVVEILPSGVRARIRNVQCYGHEESEAVAGKRVALNLAGVDAEKIERGMTICSPDGFLTGREFVAYVRASASCKKGIRHADLVRVHHGTRECNGRILMKPGAVIRPGESAVARLRLDQPICAVFRDAFVLRSLSPQETIGGGIFLSFLPEGRKRRFDLDSWKAFVSASETEIARRLIQTSRDGMRLDVLAKWFGQTRERVRNVLSDIDTIEEISIHGNVYLLDRSILSRLLEDIGAHVDAYHRDHPHSKGMSLGRVRAFVEKQGFSMLWDWCVTHLEEIHVRLEEGRLFREGHAPVADDGLRNEAERIYRVYMDARFAPPKRETVCESELSEEAFAWLLEMGRLVHITSDIFLADVVERDLREKVWSFLKKEGEATVSTFRDLLGTSRKYVVPFMEYLDAKGVTVRDGDVRRIGPKAPGG